MGLTWYVREGFFVDSQALEGLGHFEQGELGMTAVHRHKISDHCFSQEG
jgi:hypothetical protein